MSELKPCPFCGSAAEMNYHRPTESYYVACSECTAHTCDHGAEPEQAAETWNKRTQPEATKPAQDLSAAILALPLPTPTILDTGSLTSWEAEVFARGALAMRKAAAALASPADALVAVDRVDAELLLERERRDAQTLATLLAKERERFEFLHSTNCDAQGWEWGVARVRRNAAGRIEYLWGLSDHSDIDAAIQAQKDGHG